VGVIRCCEAIAVGALLGVVLAAVLFRLSEQFDCQLAPFFTTEVLT
jgi:hypothetical protein